MTPNIDSYHHISGITRRVIKSWIGMETPRPIPWTPLAKPVAHSTLALISSGGIALKSDRPFDQAGERRNPWWGDPSYWAIPSTARTGDTRMYHLHVDPYAVDQDLNVLLPLERMAELETSGEVGRLAPTAYSFMGYNLKPEKLLEETIPAIIHGLQQEAVEIVILVPAWPLCNWSVGLVQRKIEAAGFTTITLSNIPDLTASVSVPRLAAIETPMGCTLGAPGDREGQLAVLRGVLRALETILTPGGKVDLPFTWVESQDGHSPAEMPPIARHISRHPWDLLRLLKRDVPDGNWPG